MNRQMLLFVDNTSCMSALIKGFSKVKDMRTMAGICWAVIARLVIEVYIDYVWTHDNPADANH